MKTLAIDLRELRGRGTGIARWIHNFLDAGKRLAPETRIVGFGANLDGLAAAVGGPAGPWDGWRLSRTLKAESAGLWFSPYYKFPPGLAVPSVITVHDTIPARHTRRKFFFRMRLLWSLKKAKAVCTVSRTTRNELIDRWNVDPERIILAANSVGHQFTPEMSAQDYDILERRSLTSRRYLLVVSDDRPHKNLRIIIDAFSDNTDEPIVIVGTRGRNLSAPFRPLSNVTDSELPVLYRHARVLLHPAIEEGFGLPPLEAMASGTPVVVSDIAVLHEVVGGNGLYVSPTDKAGWKSAAAGPLKTEGLIERASLFRTDKNYAEIWNFLKRELS